MSSPIFSIIIPVKNEGSNVKMTLDSLCSSKTQHPYEVIIIDDNSKDKCCDFIKNYQTKIPIITKKTNGIGASAARNLGASLAKGKHLVFCDAHLTFEHWWIDRLATPLLMKQSHAVCPAIASMTNPLSIGYGQTLKHNMIIKWNEKRSKLSETAILPGGCFMIPKNIFDTIGGFESGFIRWGYEDIEISIKLWLFGYTCHVQPGVTVYHLFRQKQPYEVKPYHYSFNLMRMAYLHFNASRIKKCRSLITKNSDPLKIEKDVINSDVKLKRMSYFQKRKYDDEWFFSKFNIRF